MTSRLLISLNLLLLFAAQKVCAQTADDFFNGGAQLYISNNIPAALEKTEGGLKLYPNDVKLKKLAELLKQQQQQQSQQNQQQKNQQSQQQKSNSQQQQQNQSQNSQPQQKPDAQKQNQADQKKDDQPDQKSQTQPVKPGDMTPEEAKQLLDAQKGDEQLLKLKPDEKPQDNQKPVKDW
jgi:Mg-chelatase subunit ChlI